MRATVISAIVLGCLAFGSALLFEGLASCEPTPQDALPRKALMLKATPPQTLAEPFPLPQSDVTCPVAHKSIKTGKNADGMSDKDPTDLQFDCDLYNKGSQCQAVRFNAVPCRYLAFDGSTEYTIGNIDEVKIKCLAIIHLGFGKWLYGASDSHVICAALEQSVTDNRSVELLGTQVFPIVLSDPQNVHMRILEASFYLSTASAPTQ